MDTSTLIEEYLERLIQFKQAKDLHIEYLEEQRRYQLLKELTTALDFEEDVWKIREQEAGYNFFIYKQINADYNLNSESPGTFKKLCQHFLEKAVNLDPFNAVYLKEFVQHSYNKNPAPTFRKIQYLQLFSPASTESTSLQVDLSVRPEDMHYDYFTDEVIGGYVDAMVFLKEQVAHEEHFTSDEKLKDLAAQAGIDDRTLGEIKKEVEEMYALVADTYDDHWLSWNQVHKAYLTADKMVDLAPYNPKILEAGIKFYGHTLWRAILEVSLKPKKTEAYKAFCISFYGKEKPKTKEKIAAGKKAIEKAIMLADRYKALPAKVFEKKSDHEIFLEQLKLHSFRNIFRDIQTPVQVSAFVHAQHILFQAYERIWDFKEGNFKFGLYTGLGLYITSALLCQLVLGNWMFVLTFIMIPGLLAAGIASMRKVLWKRTSVPLDLE